MTNFCKIRSLRFFIFQYKYFSNFLLCFWNLFCILVYAFRLSKRKMPHFLPRFAVPQSLKDCIEAQGDVLVFQPLLGEVRNIIHVLAVGLVFLFVRKPNHLIFDAQVLSPSNMHARFSTLLWLEELHAERELREFNISGALLRKGAAYLHLVVNGLAEGRPSLSIGEDVSSVVISCCRYLLRELLVQSVFSSGDRIVLKKARSDGLVVEYISSVAEVWRYSLLHPQIYKGPSIIMKSEAFFVLFCFFVTDQWWGGEFETELWVSEKLPRRTTGCWILLQQVRDTVPSCPLTFVLVVYLSIQFIVVKIHLPLYFCSSRITMRRCHNALAQTKDFGDSKPIDFFSFNCNMQKCNNIINFSIIKYLQIYIRTCTIQENLSSPHGFKIRSICCCLNVARQSITRWCCLLISKIPTHNDTTVNTVCLEFSGLGQNQFLKFFVCSSFPISCDSPDPSVVRKVDRWDGPKQTWRGHQGKTTYLH